MFLIFVVVVFTWDISRGGGVRAVFTVFQDNYLLGCQLYHLMVVLISSS